MFNALTNKLSDVFKKLGSRGVIKEKDIEEGLREIRLALLEADVSLSVVKEFMAQVKEKALGEAVIKSIRPDQQLVKIVYDELVNLLGNEEDTSLNFKSVPPAVILMVGLQGSGKTTTSAKLALKLKKKKRVLLASLDIYRPAAQEQLSQLGSQISVDVLPIVSSETPQEITKRALEVGQKGLYDVLILDTAGRLQIDESLMQEVVEIKKLSNPTETLLVADALIGQEACNVAREFNEKIGITGLVLTRIDGSSRAGAALSMKMISKAPLKFLGTGEKLEDIEEFHADRLAGRILDKGDVVSLVEKAIENIDQKEAEAQAQKMLKGKFDLDDMLNQMRQMQKLGSMSSIMGMLPGLAKYKEQIESVDADAIMKKQEAIILSMTKKERRHPDIIKASRKKRIAKGSGVEVHDVNKLLKSYEQMSTMMKQMGKLGSMSNLASHFMKKNPLMGKNPFGGFNNKFPF
ncbi:MAG: signal recognition particle protein [Alphaproteobacteria bacterium]|nr:signal recognition particle protein [Alphaproteobacteria bacterium]